MRIVAGKFKSRIINAPSGDNTRPSSDKTRQAIFNVIAPYVYDANVLDIFSGSGALAIEAISRGAKNATLIDNNIEAFKVIKENVKTLKMIEIEEKEHPISMQIFGSDYKTITASAIQMINKSPIDILDVNMGCPVNKVTKSGAGSSLLKTPEKIYDIVKSLKENVNIPVTIKIRAGWDVHTINCDKVASLASSAGVDAIAIHGRTRSQMYTGTVNLDYIKMVKDVATCPVIGNGDIKDIESAKRVFDLGVEGIMIGRAALGNPYIFEQLNAYFNDGKILEKPTTKQIIKNI